MVGFIVITTNVLLGFNVVDGKSMMPTLKENNIVISSKILLTQQSIKRGDLVIAKNNANSLLVIKRVIGVPGDTIDYRAGQFFINGELFEEDYIIDNLSERIKDYVVESIFLGPDEYFIAGDNRNFSHDSRAYGPIDISLIKGKVIFH